MTLYKDIRTEKSQRLTNDYLLKSGYVCINNLFFEHPEESASLIIVADNSAYKAYDKNKFDYNNTDTWNDLPIITTITELNKIKAEKK